MTTLGPAAAGLIRRLRANCSGVDRSLKCYQSCQCAGKGSSYDRSASEIDAVISQERLASTRGFEPPTPGFVPLRLSPPLGVRGLDCPFIMGLTAFRCCPSSLYTFIGFLRSLARDWHAEISEAFPDFEQIDYNLSACSPQFSIQESCALSC